MYRVVSMFLQVYTATVSILIAGQSNAVAQPFDGISNPDNQSLAIMTYRGKSWYIADGDDKYSEAFIGQLGLSLAKKYVDGGDRRVNVINSGVNGACIEYLGSSGEPYITALKKATYAGILDNIELVVWFQGECDARYYRGTDYYVSEFRELHDSFFADYPRLERIVIVKISHGCNTPDLQVDGIRLAQEVIAASMPTVDIVDIDDVAKTSDNCHYPYVGYQEIASRIYNIVNSRTYYFPIIVK